MRRTTRMLFVEEVSDSDADNRNDDHIASIKLSPDIRASTSSVGKLVIDSKTAGPSPRHTSLSPESLIKKINKVQPLPETKPAKPSTPDVAIQIVPSFDDQNSRTIGQKRGSYDQTSVWVQKAKTTFVGHDELKTIQDTLLYGLIKELFVCMKVSGIFFIRRRKTHHGGCRGFWTNCSGLQVYCAFMCLVLVGNFFRSLVSFSENNADDTELIFKFVVSLFFYESASRAMLAFWACWRKDNGFQDLFLSIEKICYPDKIIPYEKSIRHTMQVFLLLTCLISLGNAGVTAYGMFGPDEVQALFNIYLVPLPPGDTGALVFKVFLLLLTLVNGMVAILSLTFYTIVCYILYKEFEYYCRTLAMKIRPDGFFGDDLEKFRLRHQMRCQLVENSDQIFKYYIANTYLTNVPLLCLLLYSIVYADNVDAVSYRLISCFRLLYVLFQMIVLSAAATIINDQAHAPLGDIYNIRTHSATCDRQLEVGMFLNKLTGTSIGLTAWDMFVLNKPTVLTVFGMIVTYFFILVQFKTPVPHMDCLCNYTYVNGTVELLYSDWI